MGNAIIFGIYYIYLHHGDHGLYFVDLHTIQT